MPSRQDFSKGDWVTIERTSLTGEVAFAGDSSLVIRSGDGKRKALGYSDVDDWYPAEKPEFQPDNWPPQMGDIWKQTRRTRSGSAATTTFFWHVAYRPDQDGAMAFFNGTSRVKPYFRWEDREKGYDWELVFRRP